MKNVLVIQARMNSKRLPGKILREVQGKPLLQYQIERIGESRRVGPIILATTDTSADDPVETLAKKLGAVCFRGSESDVLDRMYQAAKPHHPHFIIRSNGDSPLADPDLLDEMIARFQNEACDYLSNSLPGCNYPPGLKFELIRFSALETAHKEAKEKHEREHVTPFIHQNTDQFRILAHKAPRDLSRFRVAVDTPEDLEVVEKILTALPPHFRIGDVVRFLEKNREIAKLNSEISSRPATHAER